MPRVEVMLNGRAYAIACQDGQEKRLQELAGHVDAHLREAGIAAPGAGETMLLVMASLLLADKALDLSADLAAARAAPPPPPVPPPPPEVDEAAVARVEDLARRIEELAARLERA